MVEGGSRYLDASLILHAAVLRNDRSNGVHDKLAQPGLVVFREISSFPNQLFGPPVLIHPGQGPPYLDIPNILIREGMVPGRIAPPLIQFEVAWKRLQHGSNWNRKET